MHTGSRVPRGPFPAVRRGKKRKSDGSVCPLMCRPAALPIFRTCGCLFPCRARSERSTGGRVPPRFRKRLPARFRSVRSWYGFFGKGSLARPPHNNGRLRPGVPLLCNSECRSAYSGLRPSGKRRRNPAELRRGSESPPVRFSYRRCRRSIPAELRKRSGCGRRSRRSGHSLLRLRSGRFSRS